MHYLYATWIVLKVAEVLDYLSANGVVHRDIKTQNVMMNRQGEVKVMDLGIARQRNDNSPLKPNEPLGTLSYLPMGQLFRKDPVDVRLDIYCLGVMYYWLLTNRAPIQEPSTECDSRMRHFREMTAYIHNNPAVAPNPKKIVRRLPVEVARIVMKMMDQDVNKRYANVKDLISDLSNVVDTEGTSEKISAELSRLCSDVILFKPFTPPSFLPARKRHVRRSLWIVLSVAVLLMFVTYIFKYIDDFRHNEGEYHKLVNIQRNREGLMSFDDVEKNLDKLEAGGVIDPMSWTDEQWQKWSDCEQNEKTTSAYQSRCDELSRKADNVVWFLKNFYWVQESPNLWSSKGISIGSLGISFLTNTIFNP